MRAVQMNFSFFSSKHFETLQVFLIYSRKWPSYSTTQLYAPTLALLYFLPQIEFQFAGGKSLLVESYFCYVCPEFNFTYTSEVLYLEGFLSNKIIIIIIITYLNNVIENCWSIFQPKLSRRHGNPEYDGFCSICISQCRLQPFTNTASAE